MKNFNDYIGEKLKIPSNYKGQTLGDVYKITRVESNSYAASYPESFLEKVDEVFGINNLYRIQNHYTDYFKEYGDNREPKIGGEDANELGKILLNILFSVDDNMTVFDGLPLLRDAGNIPANKASSLYIEYRRSYSKLMYDNYLLLLFEYEKR